MHPIKTVLVLGANGFVGSHVLLALQNNPSIKVIAACRDKTKLPNSFHGEIREGDLTDTNYVMSVVEDVDVICFAAAWSSLWGHRKLSESKFLAPSLKLIEEAKKSNVKHFIFTSSVSAASKNAMADQYKMGKDLPLWPHLSNVIKIENTLQKLASDTFHVTILRLGLFVGERYGLGLLPILLPRLKTHLVPWVSQGRTHLPLVDGLDIAQAFEKAVLTNRSEIFDIFNIIGSSQPTVKELITFINEEFHYPMPHFNVPFWLAYPFAKLMELITPIVPWEPLVTQSIIYLLEETGATNAKASQKLGYQPEYDWKDSVTKQITLIHQNQTENMSMTKPY